MSIHFRCPHCRISLTASEDRDGAVVDCPCCHGAMRIDAAVASAGLTATKQRPAKAANDPSSFIEPQSLLDRKPLRGRSARAVIALFVGFVGLMLAVYGTRAGSLLSLRNRASKVGVKVPTGHGIPAPAVHDDGPLPLSVSCFRLPEPTHVLHYFEVVTRSDDPVVVKQVVYNGVYEPRVDPTPIGRGLVLNVGWPKRSVYSAFELDHTIEFLDIYTDRGAFRFDLGGACIGRTIGQPMPDLKRLTQLEDAQIELKEKAIVDARRAMVRQGDVSNPLLKQYSHPFERFASEPRDFAKFNRELKARLNASPGRRRPPGAPSDD